MLNLVSRRLLLAGTAALACTPRPARAQAFPAKAIRLVVPYPPGGPVDSIARLLAQELQARQGWTIVVENKGGASGALGAREVARAEADGHTLVLGTNQTHATNAFLLREPGYDVVADFAPVAGLADLQHALVVPKTSPDSALAEFIARAKASPGKLNYGSSGVGSASHLAMELLKVRAGLDMQHVPFRGAAPLSLEIVAGRIDAGFATLPAVVTLVQGGEMRALAIASHRRATQLPTVPLLKEQGVEGGEADAWIALFAPARTPGSTLDVLGRAVAAAMTARGLVDLATAQGMVVNVRAGDDMRAFQKAEVAKWAEVARTAKVVVE
jgi:tripartite-type tricarboxylate transporter receptor subunit TctC